MSEKTEWRFSQCFGDKTTSLEELNDADIVSAVEFDDTGEFLATGDKGGRIVIFQASTPPRGHWLSSGGRRVRPPPEYKFYAEFQSHEAEFDYLKSLEIEEKINQIRWCKPCSGSLFLLSTNDKTVKLWKVYEKTVKSVSGMNLGPSGSRGPAKHIDRLRVPMVSHRERVVTAAPRRIFANAHAYHINSISANSDGHTFLSADDLRVNVWDMSVSDCGFNIVDIKPENMEELTEVITSACFHPSHCHVLAYSSSQGTVKLSDMRARALCDRHAMLFEEKEDPSTSSFFSEIVSSVSDIEFTRDGRYIVSRDYLTLKVWDLKMESRPVKTIKVHDHLRSRLCELYENDCIFDRFEVAVSGDGHNFLTGSYQNMFHIYDSYGASDVCIEASKSPRRSKSSLGRRKRDINVSSLEFNRKALHTSWHPQANIVAVAVLNNLYLYAA